MTDLIIDNSIQVETEHGLCEIELCFGSVTKLKEKIDVLIISAFPGTVTSIVINAKTMKNYISVLII